MRTWKEYVAYIFIVTSALGIIAHIQSIRIDNLIHEQEAIGNPNYPHPHPHPHPEK